MFTGTLCEFLVRMYCFLRHCFQKSLRTASKIKLIYVFVCVGFVVLLDFFGAFTHFLEVKYDGNFVYPYEGNVREFVNALRHNEKPAVDPINDYNYTFVFDIKQECVNSAYSTFRVVYVVKSSIEHIERRSAIRNSWGFEKRFFDVPSKTVFLLGVRPDNQELQAKIKLEAAKYKDIIQANFLDSYYNNTIKTMMGFKWLVKYCSNAKFYMFVDDDMYVSVKNVLRFIRNPANYPDYLKEPKKFGAHKREVKQSEQREELRRQSVITQINSNIPSEKTLESKEPLVTTNVNTEYIVKQEFRNETTTTTVPFVTLNTLKHSRNEVSKTVTPIQNKCTGTVEHKNISASSRKKRQIFDFELPDDVRLFAGFVFVSSPHRHKSSKWYVPLSEYPYHQWPPYVTAGAYILSKEALLDMYYTSFYTKHFRFDDIFLGLVAKKADIEPFHCEEFHFYKKDYTKFNYKYVITSHGYSDPNELLYVWNEQKALGNA